MNILKMTAGVEQLEREELPSQSLEFPQSGVKARPLKSARWGLAGAQLAVIVSTPFHPPMSTKRNKSTPHPALRIVVVAPDLEIEDPNDDHARTQAERSRALRIGLLESGFNLIATLPADVFLADRISQLQPDLIIVDAESEARDALEHVVFATRDARRPIVLFTDDNDTSHVRDAVAVGVSAYIVDGLSSTRIRPILDVAMARFEYEQRLRLERDDARSALQERTVVDRAKALLMERQGLNEKEAFTKLRKAAMDKGLKIGEVAQRMLDMADLLG